MADLNFAVVFTAIDHFSKSFGEMSEGMAKFGERLSLISELGKEGAEKIHEFSEEVIEPAMATERAMATMRAMTDMTGEELEHLKARAVDFASTHPGITADEWISGFTKMRTVFHDTNQAIQAEDTAAMLQRFGVSGDAAMRLMNVAMSNFNAQGKETGDMLFSTVKAFGVLPGETEQFAMAIGRMAASAGAANAPMSEVFALAGEANRLMGGGRGAMMVQSMVAGLEKSAAEGKVGIDFSHGLVNALIQLRSQLSGTPMEQLTELKALGVEGTPQLVNFLAHLDDLKSGQKLIDSAAGSLGKGFTTATSDAADQTALLKQNVDNLYDAMATPVLPTINSVLHTLIGTLKDATSATEHHSTIARYASEGVLLLGGGVYYTMQGMSALGGTLLAVNSGMQIARAIFSAETVATEAAAAATEGLAGATTAEMDAFAGLAPELAAVSVGYSEQAASAAALMPELGGVAVAETAVGEAGAAAWTGILGPILLVIGAIAAVGFATYEIIKHWTAVKNFFGNFWVAIKAVFRLGWLAIKDGALGIAHAIARLFIGHSPIPEGPLHDLDMGREIARSFSYSPVLPAARAAAGTIGTAMGRGGSITINLNYSVNGLTPAGFDGRTNAQQIVRLVKEALSREQRLSFAHA